MKTTQTAPVRQPAPSASRLAKHDPQAFRQQEAALAAAFTPNPKDVPEPSEEYEGWLDGIN